MLDISPYFFTQISIRRSCCIWNSILHPTSTHSTYVLQALLPQKQEIPEKINNDVINAFFRYFLFLGKRGPSKVCRVGTHWMRNLIPHPTSSPDQNLSKNTGRYVKNTNKKWFFLFFLQN